MTEEPSPAQRQPDILGALVDDLWKRIDVWREWQDPRPILDPQVVEATRQVRRLADQAEDPVAAITARHAVGWIHYYRALAGPEGDDRGQDTFEALRVFTWLWDNAPEHIAQGLVPPELVELLRQSAEAHRGMPEAPEAAAHVAGIILEEGTGRNDPTALDRAIGQMAALAERITVGHPYHPLCLAYSAVLLRTRYERVGNPEDVEEAVRLARRSLNEGTTSDLKITCLSALANALTAQGRTQDDLRGVEEAVELLREAVALAENTGYPDMTALLGSLAAALGTKAEHTQAMADYQEAAEAGERALHSAVPGTSVHHDLARNLTRTAHHLARLTGRTTLLDRLAETLSAVGGEGPDRARPLDALAHLLIQRFETTGDQGHLDAAVSAAREARKAARSAADWLEFTLTLTIALQIRTDHVQEQQDIDELVTLAEQVVHHMPAGEGRRAMALSVLSVALRTRFELEKRWSDLEASVSRGRESLAAAGPAVREGCLNNFMLALKTRYEARGTLTDLTEAIELGRQAVTAKRCGPAVRYTLAHALMTMYQRTLDKDHALLNEAIEEAGASLEATEEGSPAWALRASMFGTLLRNRYQRDGSPTDGTRALALTQEALDRTPPTHPDRWRRIMSVANTLHALAGASSSAETMAEGIALVRQALEAAPEGAYERPKALLNLALRLWDLFQLDGSRTRTREEAIDLCRTLTGMSDAPTHIRMEAARNWGVHEVLRSGNPATALEPFAAMIDLLPTLVWRGAGRRTQERLLSESAGLISAAAAAAIAAGDPARAVDLLERGRGILWAQRSQDRSELSALRAAAPELADELEAVRREFADLPDDDSGEELGPTRVGTSDRRVALAMRWDSVVARVRAGPRFETFPHVATAEPGTAAAAGPVVMINLHHGGWGNHAILVTADGIKAVELPVDDAKAVERITEYLGTLHDADRDAGIAVQHRLEKTITDTHKWMWDTIAEPVLTALGFDRAPATGEPWPRLWWCPTGTTTWLPLHAAGHHGPQGGGRTVMDRVVSSYTPTLAALAAVHRGQEAASDAEKDTASEHRRERMLITSVVQIGAEPPLRGVARDRDGLAALFGEGRTTVLDGPDATTHAVVSAVRQHPWLHMGCHGAWDPWQPARSGLRLWDGMLTIAHLAALNHPHGQFAFIAACQSAVGSIGVPDEMISFATALSHGGFRHVVGTLWTVGDEDASLITRGLYPRLMPGGEFHPYEAAEALHHVVRGLRDKMPQLPSCWTHFVHLGP
ncbi:CHAT domain-containing protein [Streptomyces sp. NPDC002676]